MCDQKCKSCDGHSTKKAPSYAQMHGENLYLTLEKLIDDNRELYKENREIRERLQHLENIIKTSEF